MSTNKDQNENCCLYCIYFNRQLKVCAYEPLSVIGIIQSLDEEVYKSYKCSKYDRDYSIRTTKTLLLD